MNAIDTNVLFYSLDADEVVKQPVAVALLGQLAAASGTVLPWQVACEFLGLLRKRQHQGRMAAEDVEDNFADVVLMFPLALPTPRILRTIAGSYAAIQLVALGQPAGGSLCGGWSGQALLGRHG